MATRVADALGLRSGLVLLTVAATGCGVIPGRSSVPTATPQMGSVSGDFALPSHRTEPVIRLPLTEQALSDLSSYRTEPPVSRRLRTRSNSGVSGCGFG